MSKYIKYPKTLHLPWSPGTTSDDRILRSVDHFNGKIVVVTDKIDGENTSMYRDHVHARSRDSGHHPSRSIVKQIHARICGEIPEGWRIVGENAYAMHSIFYDSLPDYFLVFSIWDERNVCLDWQQTKEFCELLSLTTVPELYIGPWDQSKISELYTGVSACGGDQEGYVVRCHGEFHYSEFATNVAKWVRKGHIQTTENWMTQPVVPNHLRDS